MRKSATLAAAAEGTARIFAPAGLFLASLLLALGSPAVAAALVPQPAATAAARQAGRVIVKYRVEKTLDAARAEAAGAGARVVGRVRTFGPETTGSIVVVSSATLSTKELMKEYAGDPAVQYVEPDYVIKADAAVTPNDPLFGSLWGLARIGAPLAWGTSTGSSDVVVADIDTGVDSTHPDLAGNMWHNPGELPGNGIDDDHNGFVDDVDGINAVTPGSAPEDDGGHGTHTSGIMAAAGDNGTGVTGVAWTARIMALKFMGADGLGYTSDAVTCIDYMVSEKVDHGVNVVAANASWGGDGFSQTLHDAIAAAGDAGIVFVCAAGNGGLDGVGDDNDATPTYPASYDCPNIISVAATDGDDNLAGFSNFGAASVDLAAPGVGILSTVPSFVDASGYQSWRGTSMATPYVTGAVALMAAAYPAESMATRIAKLEAGVDPVAGLEGKVATGGRLDVANALYRVAPAEITGFSPSSGAPGTEVTIAGSGFTGATAVAFNGADAAFTVDSALQITATVPAGATSGPVSVTTPQGTCESPTNFTVTGATPDVPVVTGFSPTSGAAGTSVTIAGTGFTGATAVRFNGSAATFNVDSSTQITATIPAGATSGRISVTTPAGTGTSMTSFTVMSPSPSPSSPPPSPSPSSPPSPAADTTPPTVSADGAKQGAWYRSGRIVALTADDDSGVARITYSLDGGPVKSVAAARAEVVVPATPNGPHTLTFRAADLAGNPSVDHTLTFTIDTVGPTATGKTAKGRKGRSITLRYLVRDDLSPEATGMKLLVKTTHGKTVKRFSLGTRTTGAWQSVKWKPRAKGTYRFVVHGKDLAGNAQSKAGSVKVVVR